MAHLATRDAIDRFCKRSLPRAAYDRIVCIEPVVVVTTKKGKQQKSGKWAVLTQEELLLTENIPKRLTPLVKLADITDLFLERTVPSFIKSGAQGSRAEYICLTCRQLATASSSGSSRSSRRQSGVSAPASRRSSKATMSSPTKLDTALPITLTVDHSSSTPASRSSSPRPSCVRDGEVSNLPTRTSHSAAGSPMISSHKSRASSGATSPAFYAVSPRWASLSPGDAGMNSSGNSPSKGAAKRRGRIRSNTASPVPDARSGSSPSPGRRRHSAMVAGVQPASSSLDDLSDMSSSLSASLQEIDTTIGLYAFRQEAAHFFPCLNLVWKTALLAQAEAEVKDNAQAIPSLTSEEALQQFERLWQLLVASSGKNCLDQQIETADRLCQTVDNVTACKQAFWMTESKWKWLLQHISTFSRTAESADEDVMDRVELSVVLLDLLVRLIKGCTSFEVAQHILNLFRSPDQPQHRAAKANVGSPPIQKLLLRMLSWHPNLLPQLDNQTAAEFSSEFRNGVFYVLYELVNLEEFVAYRQGVSPSGDGSKAIADLAAANGGIIATAVRATIRGFCDAVARGSAANAAKIFRNVAVIRKLLKCDTVRRELAEELHAFRSTVKTVKDTAVDQAAAMQRPASSTLLMLL